MGKTIHLLQYNNYFNRTIKGQDLTNLSIYLDNGAKLVSTIQNMNLWNPNDGIDTTITSKIDMYAIPDYCLVCDPDSDIVISRWFVIEATRVQGGQYRLRLHRDVIADNYTEIINNENTYVEKGWCDVSNDAIYNKEPINFNQIKKDQIPMMDKSACGWIVGYLAINDGYTDATVSFTSGNNDYTIELKKSELRSTSDAPYCVFYMPYGYFKFGNIEQTLALSKDAAQAISKKFSSGGILLDLQILPYCPDQGIITGHGTGNIPTLSIPIKKGDTISGYLGITTSNNVYGTVWQYTRSSTGSWTGNEYKYKVNNIKQESSTTFCRLVSPNGNGVFEFDPAKMVYADGETKGFKFTMTLMPYQPYIKVEPENFGRLYGTDFNDTRGLICGGDFSMPQISDSWSAYQINNKNYQNMFNRQIESLDLQQSIQEKQELVSAITGTIGAAVQGGTTGALLGGGVGAAIGAGVGAIASGVGAGFDAYYNKQLRADQRSAVIDQHNYQIGNIQALPYAVTKATNFNAEQPVIPYLEIYSCTEQEVEYLKKYLSLYGYTINRIGRLYDYVKANNELTYLQGVIIRLTGVTDDSHYLAVIADEVKQGFYIGGE